MSEPENQSSPIAVLISDIHFTVQNLHLCTAALLQAIDKAHELVIPLIIAGDLNDSKAIIRGEVANSLINIFTLAKLKNVGVYLIPGNHDLLSAKADEHCLNFLKPYVKVIDRPIMYPLEGYKLVHMIPYQTSNEAFLEAIKGLRDGTLVIAHQGFKGANLGAYFKDDTSVDPEAVKHLRVISGHYHMHQTLGTVTYIGSPFTMSFAEANDGPKGFCILHKDGNLTQVPTNLRKHIIVERSIETINNPIENYKPGDLLQLKVTGSYNELDKLDKKELGLKLIGAQDFKLDKIYADRLNKVQKTEHLEVSALLDQIIDNTDESDRIKVELKQLWKELL